MAFGINLTGNTNAMQSHAQNGNVNVAELLDSNGNVVDMHTYHAMTVVNADYFLLDGETYTNKATAGQSGLNVVTASSLNQTNNGYARVTESYTVAGSTVIG